MNRPRSDQLSNILHYEAGLARFLESQGLNPDTTKAMSLLEYFVRSSDGYEAFLKFRGDVRAEAVLRNGGREP